MGTGGFLLKSKGRPFVTAGSPGFLTWSSKRPFVRGPVEAGQVFFEFAQVTIVLTPAARSIASFVNRPTFTLVILPTVADVHVEANAEFPSVTIVITPTTRSAGGGLYDTPISSVIILPGSKAILSARNIVSVPIVLLPQESDTASVERTHNLIRVLISSDDWLRVRERVLSQWNATADALLRPQQAVGLWTSGAASDEVDAMDNVGTPGQIYAVGNLTRGVSSQSGRRQTVGSDVSVE